MENIGIIVLGSNGMLGKYVSKYFDSKNYAVTGVNRDSVDASKITEDELYDIFKNGIKVKKNDVIINCMGTIKPQVDSLGDKNAILVNSVFPRLLADVAKKLEVHLIHPTTDCVYTGLKGSYTEEDKYDVGDVYGMSKALGEPSECTVIRTSIIGEEVGQSRSLVEWVKSSKDQTVFGFTNHFWNGVTCLQFAKVCEKMIQTNTFWTGIRHVHSNTLTKQELVQTISDVYGLNITVTPKETPVKCDRSIASIYDISEKFNIPSLETQIKEIKEFSSVLYS
jgi:dTDP-4-dehydrorhamnose reductase